MSSITSRSNWRFSDTYSGVDSEYSFSDLINYYIGYMYSRSIMMFEWKDLPNGMTSFDAEKFTQLRGATFILYDEDKDRYFILDGSAYDNISWNKEPLKAIIANPALPEINGKKYELGKNAVMIRNDYFRLGLYPMIEKNAMDIANTDISIRYASFNTRLKSLMTSDDDNTVDSINKLIEDVWNGKKPVAITTTNLYKTSIEDKSYASGAYTDIHQLIELKQYQLAHWYMELCVNANYNMKAEYVNDGEMTLNDDALLPLIDQMLICRQMACEEMNNLFGLNVSVELSSSWKKKRDEIEKEIEKTDLENEILENEAEKMEESNEVDKEDNPGEEVVEEDDKA